MNKEEKVKQIIEFFDNARFNGCCSPTQGMDIEVQLIIEAYNE